MKKIETVWHYLLNKAVKEKLFKFQQKQIAGHFGYSLSTVHHALEIPSQQGAVRKEGKFFVLQDWRKLLYYWASLRNVSKDEIGRAYLDAPVVELESMAVPGSIFAAYSAARYWLGEPPADFERVYFYLPEDQIGAWQERYSQRDETISKKANVIVLKKPAGVDMEGGYTSLPLTLVDIWNLPDWYAADFTAALENKVNELLS